MTAIPVSDRQFFGHPRGLSTLFFTEMWERFSYYGMRALLILYLLNYFRMTQEDAASIYKWYTSLVYLTPLIGGFLADRYLHIGDRDLDQQLAERAGFEFLWDHEGVAQPWLAWLETNGQA